MDVDSDSEASETEPDDDVLSYIDFDSDEVDNLSEEFGTQYSHYDFEELTIDSIPNTPKPSDDEYDPPRSPSFREQT